MFGQFDRIVQPGESGRIPVKVITKKIKSPKTVKTLTVYTNIAGADAMVRIRLEGQIWQPVEVTPKTVRFPRTTSRQAEDAPIRKLTVVNNMEAVADITNLSSSNSAFDVKLETIEPGKRFELVVSLVPPLKGGSHVGDISFSTGVPDMPTMKIPVNVYIAAEVDVSLSKLLLRPDRPRALTRQLYVRNYSKKPVNISDLAVSTPSLQVSLKDTQPSNPGNTYRLTIVVPSDYKPPVGGDKITFKTDCPSVPDVTIPVLERAPMRRKIPTAKSLSAARQHSLSTAGQAAATIDRSKGPQPKALKTGGAPAQTAAPEDLGKQTKPGTGEAEE